MVPDLSVVSDGDRSKPLGGRARRVQQQSSPSRLDTCAAQREPAAAMDGPMSANMLTPVRRFAAASIVIALVAPIPVTPTAGAQGPSESDVRAALIYKFLPQVTWPGMAPTAPLVLCIISDG